MPVLRSHLTDYEDLKIAERVREARQRRQMTLQQLADACSISIGRLSQIENGHHVLDVSQASIIANALEVPLESFFPPDISLPYQITREQSIRANPPREVSCIAGENAERVRHFNFFWPLAPLFLGRHVEPVLARIMSAPDHAHFCYHDRNEFAFILRGTVEFVIQTPKGPQRDVLQPGDCIYFKSKLPHRLRALEGEPAESLHVCSQFSTNTKTEWDDELPVVANFAKPDESHNMLHLLGRELTTLRAERGWTLKDGAKYVGLRERQLEQIERGERAVTLQTMMALARAFRKAPQEIMEHALDTEPHYYIERSTSIAGLRPKRRRPPIVQPDAKLARFFPLASGFPARDMFPYLVKIPKREAGALKPHEHHGEEFIYVLNGELELTTYAGTEVTEVLRAGDSCYFDAAVPHVFHGHTRNPYAESSAEIIDVFWCPLGEAYLFED